MITLFPELFDVFLNTSIMGRARRDGHALVSCVNPRDHSREPHRAVDDAPYGGGAGMLLMVDPLVRALEFVDGDRDAQRVLLCPQGEPLKQCTLERWSRDAHLVLVAGRYEGVDERVRAYVDEECSLGDYVLMGGEVAAMAIMEGVVRLLPGTLGNRRSPEQESHDRGILEYPQYTRPRSYRGQDVPPVLLQGDHGRIDRWRSEQAQLRTVRRRPDLTTGGKG